MKTATGLRFWRVARTARVILVIVVVALLAVLAVDMLPHDESASPTGSDQSAPAEQHSHYNFPTYA